MMIKDLMITEQEAIRQGIRFPDLFVEVPRNIKTHAGTMPWNLLEKLEK